MKSSLNKLRIAVVWWKDAASHSEDVSSGEGIPNALLCLSSGIVLEHNPEAIKLAQDLFEIQDGQANRTYRNIGVIPTEFIQRIIFQDLEVYDKPPAKVKRKKK